MESTVILVIGSNYGDRLSSLSRALRFLREKCAVCRSSEVYESPDSLGTGLLYLNAVVEVITREEESSFNAALKALEVECGRTPRCRERGEVPLDIDIVVWNGAVRRPADFSASYFRRGLALLSADPSHKPFAPFACS